LGWASLFCLIAHAAVECIAASLSMDRLASNKDVSTAMFADPVQPLLHIHFLRLLLTKRFFRVRCIFVLIVMYSASFQALVLSACSFLARPFCFGLPRGRHSLKGVTAPSNNEIVPTYEGNPPGGGCPLPARKLGGKSNPGADRSENNVS